jgi:hypothetical protein
MKKQINRHIDIMSRRVRPWSDDPKISTQMRKLSCRDVVGIDNIKAGVD